MKRALILIALLLAACGGDSTMWWADKGTRPGDMELAQKLCAGMGGLYALRVTRWVEGKSTVRETYLNATCNDGTVVTREDKT